MQAETARKSAGSVFPFCAFNFTRRTWPFLRDISIAPTEVPVGMVLVLLEETSKIELEQAQNQFKQGYLNTYEEVDHKDYVKIKTDAKICTSAWSTCG